MKRSVALIACLMLVISALALSSCDVISQLSGAVRYPQVYSLSYEVTSADGVITTITKTVDKGGNVYYKNADGEFLYILDGSGFIKYERNGEGKFAVVSGSKLTRKAVEAETSEINSYAEQSKNKLMPTAKQENDTVILGRDCEVYKLGVGTESNSSYTYYYVDKGTGICLGVETRNTALGTSVPHNGESFVCTEFTVDDIGDLSGLTEE